MTGHSVDGVRRIALTRASSVAAAVPASLCAVAVASASGFGAGPDASAASLAGGGGATATGLPQCGQNFIPSATS